jgi:NAD(P)-dependent dehydrogenase (short-subunit alcohol dehydrogenase family)
MDHNFQGRTAIVTGAGSGIGRSLCEELAVYGATVVVTDIDQDAARQVADLITRSGGQARPALLDVRREEAWRALVDEVLATDQHLDYLFNNAAITLRGEVRDMNPETWLRVLEVNLLGAIQGISTVYPIMLRQGCGHIVNISSLAGLIGFPTQTPYVTTKSALVGLSTSLRAEAAGFGVRVTVACPGYVQTPIWRSPVLKAHGEDLPGPPFKMMEPGPAARAILQGVRRNQAIIVFPLYARLLWWLYRFQPGLVILLSQKIVRNLRRVRREEE